MAKRRQGNRRQHRNSISHRSANLQLESLEDRRLLAGDVFEPTPGDAAPASIMSIEQFTDAILRQEIAEAPGRGEMVFLGALPGNTQIVESLNTFAADTTNTDQLQPGGVSGLDLTGDGYTIGVWDAGHVRGSHQDFAGGRVSYIDSSPGFDNHATHVAGTIGATGLDFPFGNAKGMATEVHIRSGDWTNDIAELRSEAANIVVSNHSYGAVAGWRSVAVGDLPSPLPGGPFVTPSGRVDVWWNDASLGTTEDDDFGQYTSDTRELDDVIYDNPTLLSVWAAGNDRNDNYGNLSTEDTYVTYFSANPGGIGWAGPGYYLIGTDVVDLPRPDFFADGIGLGYDTLTDKKVAKNTLVVGAVGDVINDPYSSTDIVAGSFSSFGATDDGRIKPDVVGNGIDIYSTGADADDHYYATNGTSMAAPNVAGSAVLLIEHYNNEFGQLPYAATSKAILIHTASDAGNVGPDYAYGWGLINMAEAADLVTDATTNGTATSVQELNLSASKTVNQTVRVTGGELKATIAWTDIAGTPVGGLDNTTSMLVNDLDLLVVGPDGQEYYPWTLDASSPFTSAVRTTSNHVDNVEQVLLEFAAPGDYIISIGATGNVTTQDFSLVIEGGELLPDDDNDQISGALSLTTAQTRIGTISDQTDVDLHEFSVSAGQAVGFDIDRDSGNLDSRLRIFDSLGTELATNDDGTGLGSEPSNLDSYLEYRFANSGTYYLGVSDYLNDEYDIITGHGDQPALSSSGVYNLTTTNLGTDINGEIAAPQALQSGIALSGSLSPSIDIDMFSFTAGSDHEISFSLSNVNGNVTPEFQLFDNTGTQLASSSSSLTYTFPTAGIYYAGIANSGLSYDPITGTAQNDDVTETGTYSFLLQYEADPLVVTTAVEPLSPDGEVSLREAIEFANVNPGPDAITFDENLTNDFVTVLGTELVITESLTVRGLGADQLTIEGNEFDRLFSVQLGAGDYLDIVDITLTGAGAAFMDGGAIHSPNNASVNILRSRLTGNTAANGGAVRSYGNVLVSDSEISGNSASTRGGGISIFDGSLVIENSTFSGNSAALAGGGIHIDQASADISSSTIAFNTSHFGGGIEFLNATSTVSDSIFSDNTATGTGPDVLGSINANFSLISNSIGAILSGANNVTGQNALLGALGNNGGSTMTHALLEGSPAINAADPGVSVGTDQNGNPRVVGGVADMGSVEANPAVVRTLGSLPAGMSTQPAYDLRGSEVIFYRFDLATDVLAANGDNLVIDTLGTNLSPENDTEMGLYDANGDIVANDDDIDFGGGNRLTQLTFGDGGASGDLNAGTYYVSLSGWNTSFGGSVFDVTSSSAYTGDIVVNFDLRSNALACDFVGGDGICNGADIDALQANIANGPADPGTFDLNGDGLVDIHDRNEWLVQAGAANLSSGNPYLMGDANLDGVVDVSDLNLWNASKFTSTPNWSNGDFNADGFVDVSDLNIWNTNKFGSSSDTAGVVPFSNPFSNRIPDLDRDRPRVRDRFFAELDVDRKERDGELDWVSERVDIGSMIRG